MEFQWKKVGANGIHHKEIKLSLHSYICGTYRAKISKKMLNEICFKSIFCKFKIISLVYVLMCLSGTPMR